MRIEYRATDRARAIIGGLGRTEDVRFSPNNRRLAIAAFNGGRIAVLDVEVGKAGGSPDVLLAGGLEISSSVLSYPHGVDFVDDDTLAVANRGGGVAIFKLPVGHAGHCELSPIQFLAPGKESIVFTPGSVSVVQSEDGRCELLICNNYADNISRHAVDRNGGCSIGKGEVLIRKWLNLPDGVCASRDGRWIAVSNHNSNGVLLYDCSQALNEDSSPVGVLRGVAYPHGLRFSADNQHLLVADAGAPFLHVYACGTEGWHGTRMPATSIRVMDEQVFRSGRKNPQEGGPKGIDFDRSMTVLATTCEYQALQFLDAAAVLAAAPSRSPAVEVEYELGVLEIIARHKARAQRALEAEARANAAERRLSKAEQHGLRQKKRAEKFKAKAARFKKKAARAKARGGFVIGDRPWRLTAPLSWLYYAIKRSD
jgi:DNA-binding beta-propeller fold protein YncE